MRPFGAGLAASGILTGLIWGVTAGSRPQAVLGGFDIPIVGLAAVIVGFLVWMVGMAKAEREEEAAWAKLNTGYSSLQRLRPVAAVASQSLELEALEEEIRIFRTVQPSLRPKTAAGRAAVPEQPPTAEFQVVY
jgi:hypothetical protein